MRRDVGGDVIKNRELGKIKVILTDNWIPKIRFDFILQKGKRREDGGGLGG